MASYGLQLKPFLHLCRFLHLPEGEHGKEVLYLTKMPRQLDHFRSISPDRDHDCYVREPPSPVPFHAIASEVMVVFIARPYSARPYSAHPYSAHPYSARPYSAHPYSARRYSAHPYSSRPYSAHPYSSRPNSAHPYSARP